MSTRAAALRSTSLAASIAAALAGLCAGSAFAQKANGRLIEDPIGTKDTPWLVAKPDFKPNGSGESSEGGVAGACPQVVSTHTNASFEGGQYIVQAGFAEQEMAACSYTVAPSDFPLRIDLCEMIFATSATTVNTTTKWSVLIWQGNPRTGTLIFSASSNGIDLPHLQIPAGTNGTNIQFGIDPGDPEQIIVQNDGSNTFSIGFRIDDHHNQVSNPCFVAPPSSSNAFPTTDVGGLASPNNNWLFAVDCGPLGCNAGWSKFSELPQLCRPTGDWVMRASWTPVNCTLPGACCLPNGTCQVLTQDACNAQFGNFNGEGSTCSAQTCSSGQAPCCFASTGGCVTLPPASCVAAGGVPGPTGQTCLGYVCFPIGACCLPDGSCSAGLSPAQCAALNGVFQGNGTTCTAGLCPEPIGAACFPNGFCLQLTQAQAAAAGASWGGPGSLCTDANGNGVPDGCEVSNPADINGDGVVNAADLGALLAAWGATGGAADINDDGVVNAADLGALLAAWG